MKKLFCVLFCVMLLLVCCACAKDGNFTQSKKEFEFQAVVKEVMDDSILVMPEDSYDEAGVAMGIGVVVAKSDLIPDVQVGDRVRTPSVSNESWSTPADAIIESIVCCISLTRRMLSRLSVSCSCLAVMRA